MMAALRNDAVHSVESLHTTLKEEELYEAGDNGDEEDALSDDSMRLRLSDDEAELDDTVVSMQGDDTENKVEVNETKLNPAGTVDLECSFESEEIKVEIEEKFCAEQLEEHNSGKVSKDEKMLITKKGKHRKFYGNHRSKLGNQWRVYKNQWDFYHYYANDYDHSHNVNNLLYPEYHQSMSIESNRDGPNDYCDTFSNPDTRFEQNNENIPHENPYWNDQWKQICLVENGAQEDSKLFANDISIVESDLFIDFNNIETMMGGIINQLVEYQEFENNSHTVNSKKNLCCVDKLIHTNNTLANNLEDYLMDITYETKFAEEGIDGQQISELDNDVQNKDPKVIEATACNEDSCEKPVNSSLNSQISENNHGEYNEITTAAVVSNNSDVYTSNKSNKAKASLGNFGKTVKIVDQTKKLGEGISNITHSSQEADGKDVVSSEDSGVVSTENSFTSDMQKVDNVINNDKNAKDSHINNHIPQAVSEIESAIQSENPETVNNKSKVIIEKKERGVTKDVCKNNSKSGTLFTSNAIKSIDTPANNRSTTESVLETDTSTVQNSVTKENSDDVAKYGKRRLSLTDDTKGSNKASKLSSVQNEPANNVLQELNNVSYDEGIKINKDNEESVVDTESKKSSNTESTILNQNELTTKRTNEGIKIIDEASKDNKKLMSPLEKYTVSAANSPSDFIADKNVESLSGAKSDTAAQVTRRKRGRRKKVASETHEVRHEETKVNETGRQKRRTAKNAEEIIRKKFLNMDSDDGTSEDSQTLPPVNQKIKPDSRTSSPASFKRLHPDNDTTTLNGSLKKIKVVSESPSEELTAKENNTMNVKNLDYVYKFFQRDFKEKLPKLKQEELEELLIQKIVETITMQGEIGRLREQARISQRNQEATRTKCQQLAKQMKDFEMVLGRYAADRRAASDKPVAPIKINRSVGLQVNFTTEHGVQNLRQLQQTAANGTSVSHIETPNTSVSPRRGIKTRAPRKVETPASIQPAVTTQNHAQPAQVLPAVTPAALMVTKAVESQHNVQIPMQTNKVSIIPNPQHMQPVQQVQLQQVQVQPVQQQVQTQAVVLNGKLPVQPSRPDITQTVIKPKTNDLIDLTDEEEKNKVKTPIVTTVSDQITIAPKAQACFQRVLPTIPGNITVTGQAASIRVVQPASQPTPTAIVNNVTPPRLAYVMQSGDGSTRQLLITSNSNSIRPVTSGSRPATFPTVTYKTGISSIANGTVRVLTTPANPTVQLNQHPAPLPDPPTYAVNPALKLPPPAPSLKISKVNTTGSTGIVLSWNMSLSDKYADIVSYQLYAYQENSGAPPSTASWKKVGDVRALPLPMACTLTQFSKGNNYYFAVRAVDAHSRKGQYSIPGNISL